MKKSTKRLIIAFSFAFLIIFTIGVLYQLKFNAEIKNMHPLESSKIIINTFAVKDSFVNMYIIESGDTYIAIDSGTNPKNLQRELNKLKIDPLKVKAVFITHEHADHMAGLSLFSNAKYYLSKPEKPFSRRQFEGLDDNSTINIDKIKIACIFIPGHTTGSVCYLVNDNQLFAGDNISIKNGKADVFNIFFNKDTETQRKSIIKLKKLEGIKYVFTAHYGYSDNFNFLFSKINE